MNRITVESTNPSMIVHSLGKFGRAEDTRYIVEEEEDGSIILTPAVVVSAQEAKLLRHPELVQRIQQQIDSGKRFPRPRH
jgi:hypothetical protein